MRRFHSVTLRKYQLGSYDDMCAAHSWDVPERYNIAQDVCDKHDRDRLAMVWEDYNGDERRVTFGELEQGLWVAAGHGPWGISTGPATARVVVDALLGRADVPAPLSARRF